MVLAVAAAFSPPAKQTATARHKARAGISRCRGGGGGALAISPDGLQLRRPGQVRVVLCCSAAPWFVTPMPIHSYSRSRVRKLLLRSSDLCIVLRVFDACFASSGPAAIHNPAASGIRMDVLLAWHAALLVLDVDGTKGSGSALDTCAARAVQPCFPFS